MKVFIIISFIFLTPFSVSAKYLKQYKKLKFSPSRSLASVPVINLKKILKNSFIFIESQKFAIKPINKQAIKSLNFLLSFKLPLN